MDVRPLAMDISLFWKKKLPRFVDSTQFRGENSKSDYTIGKRCRRRTRSILSGAQVGGSYAHDFQGLAQKSLFQCKKWTFGHLLPPLFVRNAVSTRTQRHNRICASAMCAKRTKRCLRARCFAARCFAVMHTPCSEAVERWL